MRPAELEALIEQGAEALTAALERNHSQQFLSDEERQLVERALSRMARTEVSVEEPQEPPADSEPEPKADEAAASPGLRAGKKGK